jgi:uncharacterized tellurite resistance protein B-like protein
LLRAKRIAQRRRSAIANKRGQMIKTLGQVLDNLMAGDSAKEEVEKLDDTRLAAAALLVHASTIDGYVEEAETERLQAVLKERYGLSDDQLHELVVAAERSERDAVDIYSFTSKLKKALSEEDRLDIIEMMWEIAFADGEVHGYEENLIWRTAELLGISSRERIRARKKVEAQQ